MNIIIITLVSLEIYTKNEKMCHLQGPQEQTDLCS